MIESEDSNGATEEDKANAQYIVEAVNSHQALKALNEQYEAYIEYADLCIIELQVIPLCFVLWREKNNLPHL